MLKIGIILGSIREERNGAPVAKWVLDNAKLTNNEIVATYELIDLADYELPFLGAKMTESQKEIIKSWSEKIASFDGYIFVTPEYNHAVPGAFKNALDFLYTELNNKAVALVGYGFLGAARSIENLRIIVAEQEMASVQENVNFSLVTDFENKVDFMPAKYHKKKLEKLINQLLTWSSALQDIR